MAAPHFTLSDPEWLPHRHVEGQDKIRFIHLARTEHRQFPFLTDEYLGSGRPLHDVAAQDCLALPQAPLHFLFHSAFCGSTMLLAALDRPGVAMGLSEPVLLNDVVGFRRRGAQPAQVARLTEVAMRLLARPFAPGEAIVVKPSNLLNPQAELMLAMRGEARAILLHAPLETFLISVVRKGLWCRLWVRELLEGLLIDRVVDLGFATNDYFRQSDLQVAAVGWLAQQMLFQRLADKFGPQRVRGLDSESLTRDPAQVIAAATQFYGLQASAQDLAEMAGGPAFTRHSKSGEAFDAARRSADYAQARAAHGDEIDKVVVWAEAVAKANGIAMNAPLPLLG